MGTGFSGEYCLMSTSGIVQGSQLSAAFNVIWGGCKICTMCLDLLPCLKYSLLDGKKQKERDQQKSNKASCNMYRVGNIPQRSPPKWHECSDRREPESLNVHWMAINIQYSTSYMLTCFIFFNQILCFFFFCINLVITPDVTELFVCKHWWVKVKEKGG